MFFGVIFMAHHSIEKCRHFLHGYRATIQLIKHTRISLKSCHFSAQNYVTERNGSEHQHNTRRSDWSDPTGIPYSSLYGSFSQILFIEPNFQLWKELIVVRFANQPPLMPEHDGVLCKATRSRYRSVHLNNFSH
jgi:hypothetical protein